MIKYYRFALTIVVLFLLCSFNTSNELTLFVSPNGNDGNPGTMTAPLKTISYARDLLKSLRQKHSYSKITVNLSKGTYELNEPLIFKPDDGGSAKCSVEYKAYNGLVTISGGKTLSQKWVKSSFNSQTWILKLDNSYLTVNQLFENGTRLQRSRSDMLFTKGPIAVTKGDIEKLGITGQEKFKRGNKLRDKDLLSFCTFSYTSGDLDWVSESELADAEILVYQSWDASWNKIEKIDKINKEIFLKTASYYPVGFFSNKNRYFIENLNRYLQPGCWLYKEKTHELVYMARNGEDPNTKNFVVPTLTQLVEIIGNNVKSVSNLRFNGLNFSYTVAPRGKSVIIKRNNEVEWLDSSTGFAGSQGDFASGQAVRLYRADNVEFKSCNFLKLGSYGLKIDSYSNNNVVDSVQLYDLGSGGIIVGFDNSDPSSEGIPVTASPSGNVIKNSKIHDIGIIYKSALGIAVINAVKSNIANNEIYSTPYSGISCGWFWGRGKSYTRDNLIEYNNIHNVMQSMADGGGIYTLGNQPNTIIRNNKIHDIARDSNATGSRNNGIFFDEGSARMNVDNNSIFNIQNEPIRYNVTNESDIEWGTNEIEGTSYTSEDGQSFFQSDKIKVFLHDDRLNFMISKITTNAMWLIAFVAFTSMTIWLITRRRKKEFSKGKYRTRK